MSRKSLSLIVALSLLFAFNVFGYCEDNSGVAVIELYTSEG